MTADASDAVDAAMMRSGKDTSNDKTNGEDFVLAVQPPPHQPADNATADNAAIAANLHAHALAPAAALERLRADPSAGLSSAEAERRLRQFGLNEITAGGDAVRWVRGADC